MQVVPLEHRPLKTVHLPTHAVYSPGNRQFAQYFNALLVLSSLVTHQDAECQDRTFSLPTVGGLADLRSKTRRLSFYFAGETRNDARTALVGEVGVSPLQQHRDLITESYEEDQMYAQPDQPGWETGELEPTYLRHRGGTAYCRHRAFVTIPKWRTPGSPIRRKLVFNQSCDMFGHLHRGRGNAGDRLAVCFGY